jgi:PKD repeat protein
MHIYNTTGVYNVSLRVTNAHGSDNASRAISADVVSFNLVISTDDQRLTASTISDAVQIIQESDLVDRVVTIVSSGVGVGSIILIAVGGFMILKTFGWL